MDFDFREQGINIHKIVFIFVIVFICYIYAHVLSNKKASWMIPEIFTMKLVQNSGSWIMIVAFNFIGRGAVNTNLIICRYA